MSAHDLILAVETSCDDTCAALVTEDGEILANVISSQGVHDRFGGVVPEIASRQHLELVPPVLDAALAEAGRALDDVTLVAATQGPGLVGALLVGFSAAKGLAAARRLPFAPVDHLHGHLAASFLRTGGPPAGPAPAGPAGPTPHGPAPRDPFEPPFLCLIASGGHTLIADVRDHSAHPRILGRTLDDAAGEAFDKGARMLGLGYPGGAALEALARQGDPTAFSFPTARKMPGLDFSFAGLKTALLYRTRELGPEATAARRADLAAAYQAAIVEALVLRIRRAIRLTGARRLAVGGGVAANGPLREALTGLGLDALDVPPPKLCTDNAAMIASAARYTPALPFPDYLGLDVFASGERGLAA